MNHVVLAGDSIFDNAYYVAPNQAVIDQLQKKSEGKFKPTLIAVDGSVTNEVTQQFRKLPRDATHLFISSGGNDALRSAHLLEETVSSVFEAMSLFSDVVYLFQIQYRSMLKEASERVKRAAVCTIYDSMPGYQKESLTALKMFNEVILREAASLELPIVDLRLICDDSEDYSCISPIEPSEQGGDKISYSIIKSMRSAKLLK
jgi:hypothetical protein